MPLKENEVSFLQSAAWEQFQQAAGFVTKRCNGTLAIKRPLPLGKSWIYIPRGEANDQIVEWARKEQAIFVRAEPVLDALPEPWRAAEQHVQPQHTTMLDLTKSEEELLAAMHQKTRYNIRLAEKKGVTVRFSQAEADLESFLVIKKEVEARGSFRFHSDEYYRVMLNVLGVPPDKGGVRGVGSNENPSQPSLVREGARLELAIAEHSGTPLAVHLLISHGDIVTYAHGASASQQRELMAPHLLQWESIKRAKGQGFSRYDFYGIAPEGAGPDHPWSGITRFKLGFGGERISYPGTFDYVLDRFWYWLYTLRHA